MHNKVLVDRLKLLSEKFSDLKEATKKTTENVSDYYMNRVKYLVSGISFVITDIGKDFISINEGKVFNNVLLEAPVNASDVFVKLGETKIIPGKAVPYLKQILTMSRTQKIDIKSVANALPSIEEFIFYMKSFLEGSELYKQDADERVI